jgi:hypothetical protein
LSDHSEDSLAGSARYFAGTSAVTFTRLAECLAGGARTRRVAGRRRPGHDRPGRRSNVHTPDTQSVWRDADGGRLTVGRPVEHGYPVARILVLP